MQINVRGGPTLDLSTGEGSILFHVLKEVVQASYIIDDARVIADARALVDDVRAIRKAKRMQSVASPQSLAVQADTFLKTLSAATTTLHHLGRSEFETRTGLSARDAEALIRRLTLLMTPDSGTNEPERGAGAP
ncbi:hypothetical protein OG746_37565 [Streptomyces sp. NBC_01016]|uniref:hypothetical protein n=1 Tax=Streptomyces sp. NBC_01016 TaxID=2903720 RepID=UPI0022529A5A|nr:hypothetical protein [Streptomyces sp. NBC_01016]MCX4834431.1 hypothetical protein [Streptomyces sp. NBC_01016]